MLRHTVNIVSDIAERRRMRISAREEQTNSGISHRPLRSALHRRRLSGVLKPEAVPLFSPLAALIIFSVISLSAIIISVTKINKPHITEFYTPLLSTFFISAVSANETDNHNIFILCDTIFAPLAPTSLYQAHICVVFIFFLNCIYKRGTNTAPVKSLC